MTTVIPEIRVYSPSDLGEDSSDVDSRLFTNRHHGRKPPRHIFTANRKDFLLDKCSGKILLGSPASRSGDAASSENSQISNAYFRDTNSPSQKTMTFGHLSRSKTNTQPSTSSFSDVKWENTFHMRPFNLSNFPNTTAYRSTHRSQMMAINRAKGGCITSSAKSLDILRQNLQSSINREIDSVIQRYLTNFFRPGIQNIVANNGENSVSEQHVNAVCRQMLEDAKKMYHMGVSSGVINSGGGGSCTAVGLVRGTSPIDGSDAENALDGRQRRYIHKGPGRKRKESDTDSEASSLVNAKPKKRKGRPPLSLQGSASGRSTPSKMRSEDIRREGVKWNPERLTSDALFIMGAKANKALGLGATRGRLYIKHPDVFKYSGDQDDKQWLYDQNLMPATGGKAYMLLVEDIRELAEMDEYKKSPGLCLDEIVGFTVSETILSKMRLAMVSMRTDHHGTNKHKNTRNTLTIDSLSENGSSSVFTDPKLDPEDRGMADVESRTVSPTEDLELLGNEMNSTHPSPFSLEKCFGDVISARDSDNLGSGVVDEEMEPAPLSAPFDVTTQ